MRVLVVEDDPDLSAQLAASLAGEGYAVDRAADGEQASSGTTETYDAVVLDLGLPRLDGLSVLRRWRSAGNLVPVLILTARDAWHEKVQGIDAGADDYLAKPFRIEELLARVRALIRRAKGQGAAELRCGPLLLDTRTGRAIVDGRPVPLTGHEYRVLLPAASQRPGPSPAPSSPSMSMRRSWTATPTPSRSSSAVCARSLVST